MTKAVREGMKKMEKKFGAEKIFGVHKPMRKLEVVPTGFYEVDNYVIGRGGLPRGRTIEISGEESSGKTTFFLYTIANFQKQGLVCGFVDAEIAQDVEYAQACGVNTDLWYYGIPVSGEETVEMTMAMLHGDFGIPCDLVVVDSTGSFRPAANLKKKVGMAGKVGARAQLQDELISKTKEMLLKNNSMLALISQIRAKIGAQPFEKQTHTTTSKALDHEYSFRLEVRGGTKLKDEGGNVIGRQITFKTTKNKIGNPYQECTIDMIYGRGLSPECSLLDAAIRSRIIEKAGSWFSFKGEQLGQGREQAKEFLIANPEIQAILIEQLNQLHATGVRPTPEEPGDPYDLDVVDPDFGE